MLFLLFIYKDVKTFNFLYFKELMYLILKYVYAKKKPINYNFK